ncbi:hypothetical protein BT69DRAFT_1296943 [Atractiella rhizophila]|nr:hypothetical protein BT69DRAFT_1296943 [Atractiella rhizophila]
MTTIHYTPPDLLTLYITHPLSNTIISALVRDFSLSTHEGYDPMVCLVISPRKDVLGLTAEELMRKLEAEHQDKTEEEYEESGKKGKRILSYPFAIADWDTTERGEVVYCLSHCCAGDYEESTDDDTKSGMMAQQGKVYKSEKEIADNLNLVADWGTGWETIKEVAESQGVEWREGMIEMTQSWKWEKPKV